MTRVRFHDDGTTRRDSRRGIAARHSEGEGEIAGGEDGDRSQRKLHLADGWLSRRLSVDDGPQITPFPQQRGKSLELPRRARSFVRQPRQTQARFAVSGVQQVIAKRVDLRRDFVQQIRQPRRRVIANAGESVRRRLYRSRNLIAIRAGEG